MHLRPVLEAARLKICDEPRAQPAPGPAWAAREPQYPPDRKFSAASLKIAVELEFEASCMHAYRRGGEATKCQVASKSNTGPV
jgi:hypothetical protein